MYAMERPVQPELWELLVRKEQPVHKVLLVLLVLLVLQVLMEPTERMARTHWLKLRPSPLPIIAPTVV
jgi:hypothetical protein